MIDKVLTQPDTGAIGPPRTGAAKGMTAARMAYWAARLGEDFNTRDALTDELTGLHGIDAERKLRSHMQPLGRQDLQEMVDDFLPMAASRMGVNAAPRVQITWVANGAEMAERMRRSAPSESPHASAQKALAGAMEVADGAYVDLHTGELVLREDLPTSVAFELLPHELVHVLQAALIQSLAQQLNEAGLSNDDKTMLLRGVLEGQAQTVASAVIGTCIGLTPPELRDELSAMSRRAASMWSSLEMALNSSGAAQQDIAQLRFSYQDGATLAAFLQERDEQGTAALFQRAPTSASQFKEPALYLMNMPEAPAGQPIGLATLLADAGSVRTRPLNHHWMRNCGSDGVWEGARLSDGLIAGFEEWTETKVTSRVKVRASAFLFQDAEQAQRFARCMASSVEGRPVQGGYEGCGSDGKTVVGVEGRRVAVTVIDDRAVDDPHDTPRRMEIEQAALSAYAA